MSALSRALRALPLVLATGCIGDGFLFGTPPREGFQGCFAQGSATGDSRCTMATGGEVVFGYRSNGTSPQRTCTSASPLLVATEGYWRYRAVAEGDATLIARADGLADEASPTVRIRDPARIVTPQAAEIDVVHAGPVTFRIEVRADVVDRGPEGGLQPVELAGTLPFEVRSSSPDVACAVDGRDVRCTAERATAAEVTVTLGALSSVTRVATQGFREEDDGEGEESVDPTP